MRQAGNELLDFFTHHQHQVSQLINHHHNVRQPVKRLRRLWGQAERVANMLAARFGVFNFDVVAGQIANAHFAHELVAPLHLCNAPVQAVRSLLHVGHHRREQVGNAFVD